MLEVSLAFSFPELVESPGIVVAHSLRVLQLFQSLSPSILSMANFTAAKLLTSDVGSRLTNGRHDTLVPLLQLVLDSPTRTALCENVNGQYSAGAAA